MTIRSIAGEKLTPKRFAQMVIDLDLDAIVSYWSERHEEEFEQMSEREVALVQAQLDKLAERIYRMVEGWERQ